VHTQHASCPDAQCPRAKMENIGWSAKGYNLLYGNPMPTRAGVDPGFTTKAGSPIFDLSYDREQETVDGRYQMPDDMLLLQEKACMISFDTTTSSSTAEYTSTLGQSAELDGEVSKGPLAKVKFSASQEYKESDSSYKSSATMKMTSSADCLVYRARVEKYGTKPKFTANFYAGIISLGVPPEYVTHSLLPDMSMEKKTELLAAKKRFYDLFSEFGTHWIPDMKMGSRYGMEQEMSTESFMKASASGLSVQASVKVTWTSLKDMCPGKGCGSLERIMPDLERLPPAERVAAEKEIAAQHKAEVEPLVRVMENGDFSEGNLARSTLVFPGGEAYQKELAVQTAREREMALEREGSVGLAGGFSTADKAAEELTEDTRKASMIAIGAAPAADATEWAGQTEDEPMPVKHRLRPICEMVELALYRLYGQDYNYQTLGSFNAETVSFAHEPKLNPDSKPAGQLKTLQELFLISKFDLKAAQNANLTAQQIDKVVNFCKAVHGSNDYCMNEKTAEASLTCKAPSDKKIAAQIPDCWSNRECPDIYGMNRKCSNGVCRLDYERVVDVVIVQESDVPSCDALESSSKSEGWPPQYESGYTEVNIEGRDVNDVRKGCVGGDSVMICQRKSKRPKEDGICRLQLISGTDCAGIGMQNVPTAGRSNGNINAGYNRYFVGLCYTTEGCEETKGQGGCVQGFIDKTGDVTECNQAVAEDEEGFCDCVLGAVNFLPFDRTGDFTCQQVCDNGLRRPAITEVQMNIADSGACPSPETQERVPIAPENNINGDLNQDRWCDSVYMCQSKTQPIFA